MSDENSANGDGRELRDEKEDRLGFTVPRWTRLVLLCISAVLLLTCVCGVLLQVFGGIEIVVNESSKFSWAAPDGVGFGVLVPVGLFATILLALPWEDEDIRITQIGPIALEKKIEGQAKEQEIELAEIQEEIEVLRRKLIAKHSSDASTSARDSYAEDRLMEDDKITELEALIVKFLSENKRWAFSPSRIRNYASTKPGYSELGKVSTTQLRFALRRLVKQQVLVTRVSKKGNTLYRVPI